MSIPPAVSAFLGAALTLVAGCGEVVDSRPAVWGYISPAILQPSCATVSCHGAAVAVAGLDLSTPERGYKSLTGLNVQVDGPSPRPLVVPYNPDQSRVVHMLRARNAARMPPDRPLPGPDIALIERWILNGARARDLADAGGGRDAHEGGDAADVGDARDADAGDAS